MNAALFEPHRKRLLGLAYRMLGSVASAEDVVQETWVRWADAGDVDRPGAWLTTVATRLCLDELKSARTRREAHVGPWLPEPWIDAAPPEPGVLTESLSMAFLLLLEALSPRERAAFLLRDVFEEDYARIARVLDATEATTRQWVRRARTALERDRPRFDADPAVHAALLTAFGAAVRSGDPAPLEALLAEQVVATSDGGGRVKTLPRPIQGRDKVARLLRKLFEWIPDDYESSPAWVNGGPGRIDRLGGRVFSVTALESVGGRLVGYKVVLDPLKLAHVR